MAKLIIKGKYPYHDKDKQSKKERKKEALKLQKKMMKEKDKELKKICNCNHIDSKKGKSHFKISKDGTTRICKICGGKIINDPKLLTEESAKNAALTIYSIFSLARGRLNLDEDTDKQITKTLLMVNRSPELLELVKNTGKSKKEKKKEKKNKKNKGNFNRIAY